MDAGMIWQKLPPELLRKIFSYLGDVDRCRFRLTCLQWRDAVSLPQVWSQRSFRFAEYQDKTEKIKHYTRATRFMKIFGGYVTRLNLNFNQWKFDHQTLSKLQKFMESVPCGLRMLYVNFEHSLEGVDKQGNVITQLCYLLRRQTCLEKVDLLDCRLTEENAFRLLKSLTFQSARPTLTPGSQNSPATTLKDLAIVDLFEIENGLHLSIPKDRKSFVEVMGKFSALRKVSLSYQNLSGDLLTTLTVQNPHLRDLHLLVYEGQSDEHGLEYLTSVVELNDLDSSFQQAIQKCPNLRVWVDVLLANLGHRCKRSHQIKLQVQALLVQNIPLVSFKLRHYHIDDDDKESTMDEHANVMLYLAQNFRSSLKYYHLEVGYKCDLWNRSEQLVGLVQACPSLTHLTILHKVPFDTIQQMAAAHLRSTTHPEALHITVHSCDHTHTAIPLQRPSNNNSGVPRTFLRTCSRF